MTAVARSALALSSGRLRPISVAGGPAYGKGLGRLRTLKEVVFAGQTTGVHTNGATYVYDGVTFTAFRTDANGSTEITANGLKISRTVSSTAGNGHGLYAPGDASAGGWVYQTVGMGRFVRGNWQAWLRYQSISISSMGAAFAGFEVQGESLYHGFGARRDKTASSTPAAQGANQAVAYGPTSNGAVTMTTSDTGYQYDTFCIYMHSPVLAVVYTGQYSGGWPDLGSMVRVGTLNLMTGTNHTGRASTTATAFMRDFKLWQFYMFLYGVALGDVTVERIRLTEYA